MTNSSQMLLLGFIFVLLLNGSMVKTDDIDKDKMRNRLNNLFNTYYTNFEMFRKIAEQFTKQSLIGFSAKFQEISRKNYDLGLSVLDLSNKHELVFNFRNISINTAVSNIYIEKFKLIQQKSLSLLISTINNTDNGTIKKNLNMQQKELRKMQGQLDTKFQNLKKILENIKKILKNEDPETNLRKYDPDANLSQFASLLTLLTFENEIHKEYKGFFKNTKQIKTKNAIIFVLDCYENMFKTFENLKTHCDPHVIYVVKKKYLTHLFDDIKELSDIKQKLSADHILISFLVDKSLRGSKPKYQKFYKC